MPQQLIYTSAPRGVIAGRSGHCTVARSATMREALMLQLEKLSYYQHLSLSGGQERPIYCCRILDIRGSRYHVLTRIHDAGLDFTGRTNFLAHHLVFTPEEVRQFTSPPVILREWTGWIKSWSKDPELFGSEDWSSLPSVGSGAFVPAAHWQQLTGDAANGYGLLEARAGIAFRVDELPDEQILALFAESLELLEFRDPRRDFRASAWQYTFTTSMQEQDNPADFRWRCLHADNPAGNRFAGPDTRALSEVRVARATSEEAIFARSGRQPPRFIESPQNISIIVGETAQLHAKAEGVPAPAYQWFTVDRAGNSQTIPNATSTELLVQNPPLGITRYAVRASNSQGEITSDVITLSVEQKGTAARPPTNTPTRAGLPGAPPVKSESDIERQRQRLEAEQGAKKPFPKWPIIMLAVLFLFLAAGAITLLLSLSKKSSPVATVPQHDTNVAVSNLEQPPKTETPQFRDVTNKPSNPIQSAKASRPVSRPFSDGVSELPAPWKGIQIGQGITARTSATFGQNAFIIFGAGENKGGRTDDLFFVQRPVSGSVDFEVRLKSAASPSANRQGIMIRESENGDAPFAFVGLSQTNISWLHRDAAAQYSQLTIVPQARLPIFLKLLKRTNFISGAYSMNGSNWIWLETNQIPFSKQSYLIGFAVSSGNNGTQAGSTFDMVSLKSY